MEIAGHRRKIASGMLAASFACNIAVLFLPFMNLRAGITSDPYSLINSIKMLWSSGLYVLAALVVGFSVVFPFAKLSVLAGICWAGRIDERSERLLGLVERLGKWSMLDVFIVCIILTLASGQILVGAKPLVGIPVFVVAIFLSILAGEVISGGQTGLPDAPVISKPLMIRGGVWLVLSGLALVATIGLPFLRIRDWLLADNRYSIVTLVSTLGRKGAIVPAVINGLFLVLAPLTAWTLSAIWWWKKWRGFPAGNSLQWMMRLKRWSMLDVFGLALAVFLVEGEALMNTEVRWGALFLVALLVLQRISEATLEKALAG